MNNRFSAVLGIFLLVFSVYAFVASGHYGGDAFNNYLTTESIVLDRDLEVYDRPFEVKEIKTGVQGVAGKDGKRYSPYGLGMALLQVPLYLIGLAVSFVLKNLPRDYITFFCVSFTNTFLSAVNVALLLVMLGKFSVKLKEAVFICLVYAFGTMAFVYSKAGFPEPALVTFLLISTIALFGYTKESRSEWWLAASGAALGAMAVIKVYTVILTPVFLVYFLATAKERRKFVWIPMLAFAAVWSIDLLANFSRFGNIFITGYGHVVAKAQGGNRFLKGLYYYWLSCGKGFFFYNLPLVLGLFYWRETREKSKPEFYFVVSIILVYTVFFAYFFKRGSIFSWGPRYMFPVVPLFAVLAAGVFRKRLALYVFAGLALLGFFVQLPAILTHYSSYINFAVEKLGAEEYMLNFIPDLSPIKGAWLILASVANVNFGGQGITFMFNPDPLLVRSVSAPISDYAMSDLWWSNLLKVYPNMNFVVYGTFILLILMFALGAFKLIKSDYSD